ncbi:CPBP family intramembrane glutamic endopeptidase [Nocardioides daphniae]|nr:CPBP family intramembrane glutamic endopeptidase [Nocardioides daphniae]QCC76882.1 CPBP family intramembrane metalloprotease [Nocardioides daphniae]
MHDVPQPPVPASPAPPAPADVVLEYHQLHRARGGRAWRSVVGAVLLAGLGFGLVPVLWMFVFLGIGTVVGREPDQFLDEVVNLTDVTPWALAFLVFTLVSLIPVTWAVTRLMHGLRLGWVTSVFGRMRWRYFVVCLGLSVVALLATLVVGMVTPQDALATPDSTGLNEFTRTSLAFLAIVVLVVPFQAAGEEYFFRGYLTQACGGLFNSLWVSRVVAVVVPAVLFALAHGAQDPPIFVDRLAFGLVAGVLVIATGGLEAAIAMHVLNNVLAFSLALFFGDMSGALDPRAGSWWTLPSTLTQSLVYLALAWWTARRMGLANSVWGAVLAQPQRRVYGSSTKAPAA